MLMKPIVRALALAMMPSFAGATEVYSAEHERLIQCYQWEMAAMRTYIAMMPIAVDYVHMVCEVPASMDLQKCNAAKDAMQVAATQPAPPRPE
jgi:hypothetical protein